MQACKHKFEFTIGFLVILALAFFSFSAFAAKQEIPPTIVKTVVVEQENFQDTISAVGTLVALNGITLSPNVAGRVTSIYFHSGEYVKKGTPLLEIFPDIVKANLKKAKAQLENDETNYNRYLKMYEKGFIDKSSLDKYKAQYDMSKAEVDSQSSQLDQYMVKAPFTGKLGIRRVSIGNYVTPGVDITSLQAIDPIRVNFSIPQKYLGFLSMGDVVSITSDAFADEYFGKINAINSIVNENTRTIDVQAQIPNPEHVLIPGTFVEVNIKIKTPKPVLTIPATAVVYGADSDSVFRMLNNRAVQTNIELGDILPDNKVIVTKGLKKGDVIISEGQTKLFNGFPVLTEREFQQMMMKKFEEKEGKAHK